LENEVRSAADAFPNVHFQPAVPYEQVLQYTRGADVGLVSVRPICLSYLYCLPNKLFECIQAGVPVLVNELPDCAALVEEFEVGHVLRGDSAQDWLQALQKLALQQPSFKETSGPGLQRAQLELNWEKEQTELAAIYHRIEETQRNLTSAI
jgi:glycosyltransferase involved in cell wall biosynthesis